MKFKKLKDIIKNYQNGLIAFSGGVDSTFLLKVCLDTLGKNNILAVIADSETYPEEEINSAKKIAEMMGVNYKIIKTDEICNEKFVSNPPERCYYCKFELFTKLNAIAAENGFDNVFEGSNYDDLSDFRPGLKAVTELNIISPLKDAKLTKDEIRKFSKQLNLSTWKKPSMACLSSRFPYGYKITIEELKMVEEAERYLRSLGFEQLRVRHHGELARIEVESQDIEKLASNEIRTKLVDKFKKLGYIWITMDIQGFRSGSANEVLEIKNHTSIFHPNHQ